MPKAELTPEEKVKVAIKDVSDALIENINAGKAIVEAGLRKKSAHYTLQKAKERLTGLERELME